MASTLLIKRQLAIVIKRFKFEELENAVMPTFPEISWARVRSKLIKNHKNFTVNNVWRVIEDVLDNVDIKKNDLQDRLAMLQVTDISRHNKRKIWYGYELTGSNEAPRLEKNIQDIQKSIKEEFRSNDLEVNVKATEYDNITFIHVKKKKGKKQPIMPIFFALFLGHKFFFCSSKTVPLYYVKVIAVSLGYKNSKAIKLMGKDLRSLIKLLWFKQQGTLCAEYISQPPIYQPSHPIISNNGVNYTQSKQRKNYAEQCFGKDPPILEQLVMKGPTESIQHDSVASKLNSEDSMHINWEFRSRNIVKFLTALIEKRAFTLPLPDYVFNFMIKGRNILEIRTE